MLEHPAGNKNIYGFDSNQGLRSFSEIVLIARAFNYKYYKILIHIYNFDNVCMDVATVINIHFTLYTITNQ